MWEVRSCDACVVGYSAFRPGDLFYQGTLTGGHKGLNDLYSREVEVFSASSCEGNFELAVETSVTRSVGRGCDVRDENRDVAPHELPILFILASPSFEPEIATEDPELLMAVEIWPRRLSSSLSRSTQVPTQVPFVVNVFSSA
jgi:hypothetical protein